MAAGRMVSLPLVIMLVLGISACRNVEKQQAGAKSEGLVGVVKNGKLANFPKVTIGSALDSYRYFTKKQWKAGEQSPGVLFVEFIGWFEAMHETARSAGSVERGIGITFIFNPDGSFFLLSITSLDRQADGSQTRTPVPDAAGILANIYGNRKVDL